MAFSRFRWKVAGGAKDMGTVPELIVIRVDKIERPDERYFKEIYVEEEEMENER